ncbi:MAG: extracellular solute-binding protein [Chloroflexi bacterium]|nr:extracellular solute-binding protein [Chloroflexota bacterium]
MLRILIFIVLIQAIPASCASPPSPALPVGDVSAVAAGGQKAQDNSGEAWQIKWEKMVQRAKREGNVVVYGSPTGEIREALIRGFASKYEIPVEYMPTSAPQVAARLVAEKRAGLHIPDVIIGASVPAVTVFKPAGLLDRIEPVLILPEVIDPSGWMDNSFPWVDKDHYVVAPLAYAAPKIVVNPNMVKPEEIKSYRDLLEPKWKTNMVMHDPTIEGSGRAFVAAVAYYIMGVDYIRQLARQEPFLARDHRLLAEWVARGKYPVGIAVNNEPIEQMRSAGVSLPYIVPTEGTYLGSGSAFVLLPTNAPHPNASALFINWLLSREGQIAYTDAARLQSARVDIPTTNVDPLSMRKPGVKYVSTSTEEYLLRGPESIGLAKEIFGHLLK